jgi:hypothetical protein
MPDLSILIPARNETFLQRTVDDILMNIEGDTEIIVALDGYTPEPPIHDHPRVTVLYFPESIGQRAATNAAARKSRAKYVAKCDAHCAFDKGFDVKLMADMQDDWTVVPTMRNLHIFDWVCPNGHRRYQGPSGPCRECSEPTVMDVVWIAKRRPQSTAYCFDPTPHFQYHKGFSRRPEGRGDLTETMSLQGSFFMMARAKYHELNVCDESFGSWGSQGIEVACKTWLSGGRVLCNQKTWYAHCFRTQGGDFGFPYSLSGQQVERAKEKAKELFFDGKWDKAIRPLSWLVDKFSPVPGWNPTPVQEPTKGVVYYTDNTLDETLMLACQRQLKAGCNGHQIISVSLKPIPFGQNLIFPGQRGVLTMFRQILAGLEASTADVVFLCESDVLYHPSHFQFTPPQKDTFYYNTNVWKVRASDGHCLRTDDCQQVSGLCAYRDLLLQHYRLRVARIEAEGKWDRCIGFEPGTHRFPRGIDGYGAESWESEGPNIDIRHDHNLTPSRWSPDQFRNGRYTRGWTEADWVPGWGTTGGRFHEFLREIGV